VVEEGVTGAVLKECKTAVVGGGDGAVRRSKAGGGGCSRVVVL